MNMKTILTIGIGGFIAYLLINKRKAKELYPVRNSNYLGCTDSTACNYNDKTTEDDGSCFYAEEGFRCNGNPFEDMNNDGYVTTGDLLIFLGAFNTECTEGYNCPADFNKDGAITVEDLLLMLDRFGYTPEEAQAYLNNNVISSDCDYANNHCVV